MRGLWTELSPSKVHVEALRPNAAVYEEEAFKEGTEVLRPGPNPAGLVSSSEGGEEGAWCLSLCTRMGQSLGDAARRQPLASQEERSHQELTLTAL